MSHSNITHQIKENYYEVMVFRIRLIVLVLTCVINVFALLIFSNYSPQLMILTCFAQVFQFYVLLFQKNDYVIGMSFQIFALLRLVHQTLTSQTFYFSLTSSLTTFILYSLQFYPPVLNILFAILNLGVLAYHKSMLLESISLDEKLLFPKGSIPWLGGAVIIFFCMSVYQIYNEKIWKDYDCTKKLLIQKNKELEQANSKMEEMLIHLRQTNQKLELTNKNLGEALKSQDLFVACVSHELRNPLNAMLGNIELLQLEQMDANKKKMLKTCQICGDMLLVLINNVLDVAKINSAKLEINMGVINMHNFTEKIWGVSRVRILQKGLYGKLMISKDVPLWLKGDFHRLIQIILNLVGNATKFTIEGGVKILISWEEYSTFSKLNEDEVFDTAPEEIEKLASVLDHSSVLEDEYYKRKKGINKVFKSHTWTAPMRKLNQTQWILFSENDDDLSILKGSLSANVIKKGVLVIQVVDTGCGIAPEAQSKLFHPFVQADSSITRKYGGTGLGLYIIRELVQKMNGTITFSSDLDKGAQFTIKIPLSTVLPEEVQKSKETSSPDLRNEGFGKINPALIVDDSPYNQSVLKTYFNNLKLESEIAENGLEALKKIKDHPVGYYSMVTMDIQMPVMDGITACKFIRQYEKDIRARIPVPIIIVTGNCSLSEQNECLNPVGDIRASYFFRKPFFFADCKLCVESILSQNNIKQKKILIVDDDAFNRELLQIQLNKLGLQSESCSSGLEAIKRLKEDRTFGIVLMDFEMPGMSGIETTKYIRNELKLKDLCIIGTTGNIEEETNKVSLESGMNKVLTKPISLEHISSLLTNFKR